MLSPADILDSKMPQKCMSASLPVSGHVLKHLSVQDEAQPKEAEVDEGVSCKPHSQPSPVI